MVLAKLLVSDQFFKMKRSWRFEERCTVLFGAVFVMTVRATDCKKDLDVYEIFIETGTQESHGSAVEHAPKWVQCGAGGAVDHLGTRKEQGTWPRTRYGKRVVQA